MANTALAFDTLQYAKRLKQAGFTEQQAEVQAEALRELIDEKLATKHDIKVLREATRHDIEALKHDIETFREATKHDIEMLRMEVKEISYKSTMKLGSITVACFTLLGVFLALIKFLA